MDFKQWGWGGVVLLSLSCGSGQTGSPVRAEVLSCECQQLIHQDLARATVLSVGRTTGAHGDIENIGVFEIESVVSPSSIFNELDLHRRIYGPFSTQLACDTTPQPIPKVGDSVFVTFSDDDYYDEVCLAQEIECDEKNCALDGPDVAKCSSDCRAACVPDRTQDAIATALRVQSVSDTFALGNGKTLPFSEVLYLRDHETCESAYPDPH